MGSTANDAAIDRKLRALLTDLLGLSPDRVARFDDATPLFGALPELDSMVAANLLGELEDRFGIVIDNDDIDGELMASFGNLRAFVRAKTLG